MHRLLTRQAVQKKKGKIEARACDQLARFSTTNIDVANLTFQWNRTIIIDMALSISAVVLYVITAVPGSLLWEQTRYQLPRPTAPYPEYSSRNPVYLIVG